MNQIQVCKTFIRRFDPGPRLQSNHSQNQSFSHTESPRSSLAQAPRKLTKGLPIGEDASKRLAASLARSLAALGNPLGSRVAA